MVSAAHKRETLEAYGPSVDSEVAVAVGLVGSRVGDGPGRTSCPSLTTHKVALVIAPSHIEVAAVAVGVGGIALPVQRKIYVSKDLQAASRAMSLPVSPVTIVETTRVAGA